MRAILSAAILFGLASLPICAQQIDTNDVSLTIDGRSYQHVRWGKATLSTVTIFHSTGVATIPLWKLPKDLQERFGYDPQKVAAYQQQLKYNADTRLFLDGRPAKATQQGGSIVANPATVRDADGRTYKGIIISVSHVVGYTVTHTYSPGYGGTVQEGAIASPSQFADENIFVRDFLPTNQVGTGVSFQGVLVNPIGGYTTWAVARKPSFEEWQKLQN